jgi:hypothetical protein
VLALLAALPCFYLSFVLFGVWADPMARDGGSWVRFGVGLLLLEFLLLHSGAFIAALLRPGEALRKRVMMFTGMLLFYALMVWAFAHELESPGLLWIFAAVTVGRMLTALQSDDGAMERQTARSALGVTLYLMVVAGTIFLPIPGWGINGEVLAEVYPQRGDGIWEKEPQRAIAGASVYFLLIGLAELFIFGRKRPQSSESAAVG